MLLPSPVVPVPVVVLVLEVLVVLLVLFQVVQVVLGLVVLEGAYKYIQFRGSMENSYSCVLYFKK